MHILRANFKEDPNIGLHVFCNDRHCLVPASISDKQLKEFQDVLKVPAIKTNIAGTALIGAFVAGNNDRIIVPSILFDREIEALDKSGIKYTMMDTELTALGNNIIASDHGVLVNPDFSAKDIKFIEKWFGLPVKTWKIHELNTLGSLARVTTRGCIATHDIQDFEKEFIEEFLKTSIRTGTVNFGSPYVSSGLVCNSNGFLIGGLSSGPEIVNIDEGLGFIEG